MDVLHLDDIFGTTEISQTVQPAKGKPPITVPDLSMLQEDQKEAIDNIIQHFVRKKESRFSILSGVSGSGKTFTLDKLIQVLVGEYYKKVAVTATTHQAVKQLRKATSFDDKRVYFGTIQKLLGMKMQYDDEGNETFIAEYNEQNDIYKYDVVIVDEISQLNDMLFDILNIWADKKLIIFCGDPCQIPPVNKVNCIPFDELKQKLYQISDYSLKTVKRQALDNPIIALGETIRQNLHSASLPIERTSNEYIHYYNQSQVTEFFETLNSLFVSDAFKKDVDHARVVCWRNTSVASMNVKIRHLIYKDQQINKIMIGEKLIANKAVIDSINSKEREAPSILFNTNDEFEVRSFELDTLVLTTKKVKMTPMLEGDPGFQKVVHKKEVVEVQHPIKYYRTVVDYQKDETHSVSHVIRIVHEESEAAFKNVLATIVTSAKSERNRDERKLIWEEYWNTLAQFADVSYAYAITGHKCQGATYENAVIIESDIDHNPRVFERNRIKYTSFTRPRKHLHVLYKA